jgi:mRNA interferase MazF
MNRPLRGEIWLISLDRTERHEQAKTRPCLIISNNKFNRGAADLVIAVPLTSKNKHIPLHVTIKKTESNLGIDSCIMPEQIRSLAVHRCIKYIDTVSEEIFAELQQKIKIILDLK